LGLLRAAFMAQALLQAEIGFLFLPMAFSRPEELVRRDTDFTISKVVTASSFMRRTMSWKRSNPWRLVLDEGVLLTEA
jgi:hypothetical protein